MLKLFNLRSFDELLPKSNPWTTDEWKETRKELLGNTCEQCGSSEKLVLMHTWKPPSKRVILHNLQLDLIKELLQSGEIVDFDQSSFTSLRAACPKCNSIRITVRKVKQPKYRCVRCKFEFSDAVELEVADDYLLTRAENQWMDSVTKNYDLETKVASIQEDYTKRYLSGEGTKTFCKKCHFLWTQKGMKLCTFCKENYHKRSYEKCYSCVSVICSRCNKNRLKPQPGEINICETCADEIWETELQ